MKRTHTQSDLIARTLWQVETDLSRGPDLPALAEAIGVSRFHLTRAFSLRTGLSLGTYVRRRRLSEAAKARSAGDSVTNAAFDAGYDSVEGFSRVFRACFGLAPSSIRCVDDLNRITLQEAIEMPKTDDSKTPMPEIRTIDPITLVGRSGRFTMESRTRIPALWDETVSEWHDAMIGGPTYGVCSDFSDTGDFTYTVAFAGETAEGLDRLILPGGTYAVFAHEGHISTISRTWDAIFAKWAPEAEYDLLNGPEFELYDADFDPKGEGKVAVWVPIAPRG
ncbi:AraC family transcriptional regulator [Nioella sp. MMSF_3534]|uniref:AraC family transcriptional regulator n=1 Tax=Nioella sp. MMSF_3534 TaxID=3046720 RepID=UPI00273D2E99|nr:AraC family transcriptional regulator [Nioella sp. MMSF_3534]